MVVVQAGEVAVQMFTIYLAQGLDESVILSVSRGVGFIFHVVYPHFHRGDGFQSIRGAYHIAHKLHLVVWHVVLQHVINYIGQVVLRHQLLTVTQLGHSLGYRPCLLRRKLQSQILQVFHDVGLA